jgi:hypothetical protein
VGVEWFHVIRQSIATYIWWSKKITKRLLTTTFWILFILHPVGLSEVKSFYGTEITKKYSGVGP